MKASPPSAAPRILLDYHFRQQEHSVAARRQFQRVAERKPGDEVSRLLVDRLPDPTHKPVASAPASLARRRTTETRTAEGDEVDPSDPELETAHAEGLAREAAPTWVSGACKAPMDPAFPSNCNPIWRSAGSILPTGRRLLPTTAAKEAAM